ncbi:MAG: hypothetical protein LBE01_01190 [Deltaproteobacteria bacterium]|jgi:hypothetical protein|nr:hypothetical protein [Deltaproteobacteria bacterium]
MDLFENPFYLLGASIWDDSAKLAERVEVKSISLNYKTISQIMANLNSPRHRLAAEVAWLADLKPEDQPNALLALKKSPESLLELQGLPPLSKANLLTAALAQGDGRLTDIILALAAASAEIDPDQILETISQARAQAGWPAVQEKQVKLEVKARQAYFLSQTLAQLAGLSPPARLGLVRGLVEKATNLGEKPAPPLVAEIMDSFAKEVKTPLAARATEVYDCIFALHSILDSPKEPVEGQNAALIHPTLEKLIKSTKRWDAMAQPFQILAKSQSQKHPDSQVMAMKIRELAFYAYNAKGLLPVAQSLTELLREVFAESEDVSERAEKDKIFLDQLAKAQRERDNTQFKADFLNRILAVILEKIREIGSDLEEKSDFSAVSPKIEELQALLGDISPKDKDDQAVQKVALMARALALSLCHRYGRPERAMDLLTALGRIFGSEEPFASLFASDLEAIGQIVKVLYPKLKFIRESNKKLLLAIIILFLILLTLICARLAKGDDPWPEPPLGQPPVKLLVV